MNDALKEQVLSALEKIKTEADTLIAERDALKHALRKAQDACQRLREERDAAKIEAGWSKLNAQKVDKPATFTPALGASPKTRDDFAACPVGTQIQFREEKIRWEKKPSGEWTFNDESSVRNSGEEMARMFGDWPKRITLLPLARIPPAPPAVIRKGQKIDTPAQYDALPPGSRVRKAGGDWWTKMPNGDWWCAGEKMRDLAFPRTVLRIGYDENVHTCLPSKPADRPALRVGDVLRTVEDYERAPIGTKGNTNGLDFTWTRVDGGWVLDRTSGGKPCPCERMACRPFTVTHVPARFHVGQVISTREEYEALPVGATMQTLIRDSAYRKDNDGFALTMEYGRPPREEARPATPSAMDGVARIIRSLP